MARSAENTAGPRRATLFIVRAAAVAALASGYTANEREEPTPWIMELRSYNLREGARPEFRRLFEEAAIDALRRASAAAGN